jgi:hypothetical protein
MNIQHLFFTLLLLPSSVSAQLDPQTLTECYDHQTIFLARNGYFKDGNHVRNGFFVNRVAKLFRPVETAYKPFIRGQWQGFGGGVCIGAGVNPFTFGIAGLTIGNQSVLQTRSLAASVGIGALLLTFGAELTSRATTNLYLAQWEYNRVALLGGQNVAAKSELARRYDEQTIRLTNFGFYQNGRYEKRGHFWSLRDPLAERLRTNGIAYGIYSKGHRQSTLGQVLVGMGLVGNIVSLTQLFTPQPAGIRTDNGFNRLIAINLASLGAVIGGSVLLTDGREKIQRSIWLYNRNVFANGTF